MHDKEKNRGNKEDEELKKFMEEDEDQDQDDFNKKTAKFFDFIEKAEQVDQEV